MSNKISAAIAATAIIFMGLTMSHAASINFNSKSAIPQGYFDLCANGAAICSQHAGKIAKTSSGAISLSASLNAKIEKVNASVNQSIRFVNDRRGNDQWSIGVGRGDCEDYALTKKSELIAAGFPSSSLVIATGWTSSGEVHAVLIVRTDRGDLVLDNRSSSVRQWTSSLYRWNSVQSPNDTWTWYNLA